MLNLQNIAVARTPIAGFWNRGVNKMTASHSDRPDSATPAELVGVTACSTMRCAVSAPAGRFCRAQRTPRTYPHDFS